MVFGYIIGTICAWIGVGLGVTLGVMGGITTEMINRIVRNLWPHIDKAVMAEVFTQAKPQLEQVKAKVSVLEDIVLDQENFTIGDVPLRLGGFKTYHTGEDELILEVPIVWGSNCKFHVKVLLRLGPLRLYIPIEVSGIQLKVDARITIKPLVERLPCLGGVNICLLHVPHVDLCLKLFKAIDLMALPAIQDGVRFGIKYATEDMLVYPNSMSFPLMNDPGPFGLMPPPRGTLSIIVHKAEGLNTGGILNKLDAYIMLEIRDGRNVKTQVKRFSSSDGVTFDEKFDLVVDLPDRQVLKIRVFDDNYGWDDPLMCYGELALIEKKMVDGKEKMQEKEFLRVPNQEFNLAVPLFTPTRLQKEEVKGRVGKVKASKLRALDARAEIKSAGSIKLRVTFTPFVNPANTDMYDSDEEDPNKAKQAAAPASFKKSFAGRVGDLQKGVLTCTLIRAQALQSKDKNPDPYVKLTLSDPDPSRTEDIKYQSDIIFNDSSPKFDQKFDFVMISASSTLYLSIYDKVNSVFNTIKVLGKVEDQLIGRVAVLVKEVADNGRLQDTWTLSDAKTGTIDLALEWHTCHVADG